MENLSKNIVRGNCEAEKSSYRGWVIGHFMDKGTLKHSDEVEVKWSSHVMGEQKQQLARNIQDKTLFYIIQGRVQILFPR